MNLNTETYFAQVPKADIPRSVFDRSFSYKTTMNTDYLVPVFIDEALPGDSMKLRYQVFGRLLNPLVCPVMDELYLEVLFFKCPIRLLWSNWERFCGAQDNPTDSTDYLVPVINSSTGFSNMSIFDYFGIPTAVANLDVNSLPLRMYNLTYNQWFRDENLINSVTVPLGDSDSASNYTLLKSAKMHDYFTSCLPFAQKGDPVLLPLGEYCRVFAGATPHQVEKNALTFTTDNGALTNVNPNFLLVDTNQKLACRAADSDGDTMPGTNTTLLQPNNLYGDLRNATASSINDIRFAFQLQKYRERNARSGTRYTEYVLAHYGVHSPDARLQRVEFLGSSRTMIDINSVIQTGGDGTTPNATITAYGVVGVNVNGFSTSFTEHSYILGLARIRHNPLYQQGLNRLWSRSTLLDFYDPLFACIGEQPVLNKELVAQGGSVLDVDGVTVIDDEGFGFQEAWADYRYHPSIITGKLRSNDANSLDIYHFAQYFASSGTPYCPKLNQSFIEESVPITRSIAVANEPQFLLDFRYFYKCARPMPIHSVPGLVDHF